MGTPERGAPKPSRPSLSHSPIFCTRGSLRIRRHLGKIPQPSAHGAPKEDTQRSPARGSLGVQYALHLTPRETTTPQWERDVLSSQQLGKETCTRGFLTQETPVGPDSTRQETHGVSTKHSHRVHRHLQLELLLEQRKIQPAPTRGEETGQRMVEITPAERPDRDGKRKCF